MEGTFGMNELTGKIIVITGGGSGIGLHTARIVCEKGGHAVIVGRNAEKLARAASEIRADNRLYPVTPIACDISSYPEVESLFSNIRSQIGLVYGLVSNAGVNPSRTAVLETSKAHWDETLSINLTGAYHCTKFAIEQMKEGGEGAIVMVASIAAVNAMKKRCAYSASKWGMIGLTKSLAIDYASDNIRVNAICPGYVKTELVAGFLGKLSPQDYDNLKNSHALGRFGTTDDIGQAILFLLSPRAGWITGVTLPVDGGYGLGKEI